jgi:hypothetical protein
MNSPSNPSKDRAEAIARRKASASASWHRINGHGAATSDPYRKLVKR